MRVVVQPGAAVQRGLRVARDVPREAQTRLGLEVTGTASITSLAEEADDILARLRTGNPDVLLYFGLGVSSRAVAVAREKLSWDIPVLANSAPRM